VVLAFDSDEAGSRAALRGDQLDTPFRLDLDLRVAVMPDGLDPADLVQEGRGEELVAAVTTARPLLEHRIDHEVAKFDLDGPEGRARALHSAAAQLRKVSDGIARREYMRYVARRVGVDLGDVEAAVDVGRSKGSGTRPSSDKPFDRIDVELLRLVLTNNGGLTDLTQADFLDQRLGEAYAILEPGIASTPQGTPLDISDVEPLLQGILLSLALDDRPLASIEEITGRVRERRLDAELLGLQAEMDLLTPGSEPHSAVLQRMMALQREKRTAPTSE
jgi:hypothetical protein